MAKSKMERHRSTFARWFHRNFDDLFFRALIGPAQVDHAICGGDQASRDHWKRDLEARKRYSATGANAGNSTGAPAASADPP